MNILVDIGKNMEIGATASNYWVITSHCQKRFKYICVYIYKYEDPYFNIFWKCLSTVEEARFPTEPFPYIRLTSYFSEIVPFYECL